MRKSPNTKLMRSLWNILLNPKASLSDDAGLSADDLLVFFFAAIYLIILFEVQNYKEFLRFHHKVAVFLFYFTNFARKMKKRIYNKFDKARISALPRVLFEGRIVVVLTERDAEKAVRYLLSQPILGVDTETRPSFKKGQTHQVALLQVSSYDVCFLFRLNQLGLSPSVKRLLEDATVPKIGLSLRDDLNSLHKLGDFNAGYFVDLQDHVSFAVSTASFTGSG